MRWGRNLRLSSRALARFRVRTALSISGVAVGIASVVMLIGAGIGAERAIEKALEPLGFNLLVVNPARSRTGALRGVSREAATLTVDDARAIAGLPAVLRVAPVAGLAAAARAGGRTTSVNVYGTTPDYREARNFPVVDGRFIDGADLRDRRRVAVVGPKVVAGLFRGESPLGEVVRVDGVPFRVIGVTRSKGVGIDGSDQDDQLIVPLTAAMSRLRNTDHLDRAFVQAVSEEALAAARAQITTLLRRRHALDPDRLASATAAIAAGRADDFVIRDQTAIVRARRRLGGSFSRVVAALGAVTLGLGGIGLLAVSLLSVRERYAEIGLRLAVGGRPRDILVQFFTEALLISGLGGLVGLAVGAGGIALVASMTRWPMVLSWQAVVYPLSISVAIAVVFGAYPALRAARLDPIRALNSR